MSDENKGEVWMSDDHWNMLGSFEPDFELIIGISEDGAVRRQVAVKIGESKNGIERRVLDVSESLFAELQRHKLNATLDCIRAQIVEACSSDVADTLANSLHGIAERIG